MTDVSYSKTRVRDAVLSQNIMSRQHKQTIEYFPHYIKSGRTIYQLENKFGNDGYAFWFKLLELLGDSDGHYYDCSKGIDWQYLLAITRVTEEKAQEIIGVLIELGKIDKQLWEERRVIWVDTFVQNLIPLYQMRRMKAPQKPVFDDDPIVENGGQSGNMSDTLTQGVSDSNVDGNEWVVKGSATGSEGVAQTCRIVKYSKVKKSKGEEREKDIEKETSSFSESEVVMNSKTKVFRKPTVEEVGSYCQERSNGIDPQSFIDFYESKGWFVGKNKMKDWKDAVRNWENRRKAEKAAGPQVQVKQIQKGGNLTEVVNDLFGHNGVFSRDGQTGINGGVNDIKELQ